jgi:hypothetical protein
MSVHGDRTTDLVVDHLFHLGANHVWRQTAHEFLTDFDIHWDQINQKVKISREGQEVQAIWLRRISLPGYREEYSGIPNLEEFINRETHVLFEFIFSDRRMPGLVNEFRSINPSKLEVLQVAAECGFRIPASYLASCKEHTGRYKHEVTKALSDGLHLRMNGVPLAQYTAPVEYCKVSESTRFLPSLIQERIEKLLELRICYLDSMIFSMAILSQENQQTQVDYRIYNWEHPNRYAPFLLPDSIQSRLRLMMKKLNLRLGTIDMILTPQKEYIFLEINPGGQFSNLSYQCNYNLEYELAKYMIKIAC